MKIKSQKGSIALFVLIALLFYMGFLLLLYANNLNKIQTISEKIDFIKSIYEKNINNIDDVYNRRLAKNDNMQPIIKEISSSIITNITKIESSYEEYGATGGNAEYIVFDSKFSSLKDVIEYAEQNRKYGNVSIVINAYGNNGLVTTENKDIEIIRGMIVTNEAELNTAFATIGKVYVYVANNIECTNTISADNIEHKLDLNNNTISYTKQNESFNFLTFGANSNVTIMDSSNEKKGTIIASLIDTNTNSDGNDRENSIGCIINSGTLNIEYVKISTKINQSLIKKNSGSAITDTAITISNTGTVNLNGGNIITDVYTNAVVWAVVADSNANATGISNSGTIKLNSGTITTKAEASMQKAGMVLGRTFAYAYGINNFGSIENSNNVVFSTNAIANSTGTYHQDTDRADIKQ